MLQFIDSAVGRASDGNLIHVISRRLSRATSCWKTTYTEKTAAVSRKRRATMLISRPARPSENLLVEGRPDP
jgi:hypothetical protein